MAMTRYFTLEYWIDDEWYVGALKEVPGVFSQGESLEALIANIQDAYALVLESAVPCLPPERKEMEIAVNL
jgi:predicted RNase H-like HicB family nuclease